MNYEEIKKEKEKKLDELLKECGVFWAFSDKQFQQNRTPLKEGEKFVQFGAGSFLPKSKFNDLYQGFDIIAEWEKEQIRTFNQEEEHIKYELYNHECFYTGRLDDAYNVLPYEKERIKQVYQSERKNAGQVV